MEVLVARAIPDTVVWFQPSVLFWMVIVAATMCAVAAIAVIWVAARDELAELGLVGGFLYAVSVLPLVHGLTTPGVVYGPNRATMAAAFWALPIASIVVAPLLMSLPPQTALLRSWRTWVGINVAVQTLLAGLLLLRPNLIPFPQMASPAAAAVAFGSLGACLALSARHLRLYWIGRASGSYMVAVGFALIGAGNLIWLARAPYTVGFWLAHALDIGGVLAAAIYAGTTYRQGAFYRSVIAPLVADNPTSALELGLDPIVHRFIADLERKDPITRDHVVRTSELALAVGAAMALPATQLRNLGLAALLHDIGKLEIPDAVLLKPGRLSPDEFKVMQGHAALGERLVLESRVLAEIAPLVRAHHERVDGAGYPDGLAGDRIPLLARIVSVCDGFDAMAHDRQYREGLGVERAAAVLREHADAQWDGHVVAALMRVRQQTPEQERPRPLDNVGRGLGATCACTDALPPALQDA